MAERRELTETERQLSQEFEKVMPAMEALLPLAPDSRVRVLWWLADRFEDEAKGTESDV